MTDVADPPKRFCFFAFDSSRLLNISLVPCTSYDHVQVAEWVLGEPTWRFYPAKMIQQWKEH
jgi:hypothetical protein